MDSYGSTSSPPYQSALSCCRPIRRRDDRQQDMRRVRPRVPDRLLGHADLAIPGELVAGVEVAVVAREVAGGDLDADAVPGAEEVAGDHQVDLIAVDLLGLEEARRAETLPIAA